MRTLLAVLTIAATPALAQDAAKPSGEARIEAPDGVRYTMRETPEGTLRLDVRTGEMTLCTTADGRLVCRMGADERAAFMAEIARLDARIDALAAAGRGSEPRLEPEDERRIDRALAAAGRLMRGMRAIVGDLQGE